MKFFGLILTTLLFVSQVSQAQSVINMPTTSTAATVTFDKIAPTGGGDSYFWASGFYGNLSSRRGQIGGLTCLPNNGLYYLTARVQYGGRSISGNFQFDSFEKCWEIGNAWAANPSGRVTFVLSTLGDGRPYIGQVAEVRFH